MNKTSTFATRCVSLWLVVNLSIMPLYALASTTASSPGYVGSISTTADALGAANVTINGQQFTYIPADMLYEGGTWDGGHNYWYPNISPAGAAYLSTLPTTRVADDIVQELGSSGGNTIGAGIKNPNVGYLLTPEEYQTLFPQGRWFYWTNYDFYQNFFSTDPSFGGSFPGSIPNATLGKDGKYYSYIHWGTSSGSDSDTYDEQIVIDPVAAKDWVPTGTHTHTHTDCGMFGCGGIGGIIGGVADAIGGAVSGLSSALGGPIGTLALAAMYVAVPEVSAFLDNAVAAVSDSAASLVTGTDLSVVTPLGATDTGLSAVTDIATGNVADGTLPMFNGATELTQVGNMGGADLTIADQSGQAASTLAADLTSSINDLSAFRVADAALCLSTGTSLTFSGCSGNNSGGINSAATTGGSTGSSGPNSQGASLGPTSPPSVQAITANTNIVTSVSAASACTGNNVSFNVAGFAGCIPAGYGSCRITDLTTNPPGISCINNSLNTAAESVTNIGLSSSGRFCVGDAGSVCTTAANSCGMKGAGTVRCDGQCSELPPSDNDCAPPGISLSQFPALINPNNVCTISWSVTNATACSLSSDIGDSVASTSLPTGTHDSPPLTVPATYTMLCHNGKVVTNSVSVKCSLNPQYKEI